MDASEPKFEKAGFFRSFLYNNVSFILGLTFFCWGICAFCVGFSFLFFLGIGAVLLLFWLLSVRFLVSFDMKVGKALLGKQYAAHPKPLEQVFHNPQTEYTMVPLTNMEKVKALLEDSGTWFSALYTTLLKLPLSLFIWVMSIVLLCVGLGFAFFPGYRYVCGEITGDFDSSDCNVCYESDDDDNCIKWTTSWWVTVAVVPLGFFFLFLEYYFNNWGAHIQAALAKHIAESITPIPNTKEMPLLTANAAVYGAVPANNGTPYYLANGQYYVAVPATQTAAEYPGYPSATSEKQALAYNNV
eukprot:GCRY01000819.1.p1 GENE.GCRY01000819.1~~GCRY01000819.1.p1  ORF type:complete len:300 (-),score=40.71 GCRY01000819.1:145-1044(-)